MSKLASQEACQLFIEQEIEAGLAEGKTKYFIGNEIAEWIEKLFGAEVKSDTIKKRAQRYEQKIVEIGTNVPNLDIDNLTEPQKQIIKLYERARKEKHEARKVTQKEKRDSFKPSELPQDKFQIIYADPPWRYEFSETVSREIENQYPTMSLEEIKTLPVQDISADDCVLLLWVTSPKLIEGIDVLRAWEFQYVTCAVWDKQKIGMGYYFRQQHEILLVGKKGGLPVPDPSNRASSVISSPREKHSKKPDIVYELIEQMYPEYNKLEMFSRKERNGWKSWGDEAP